MTAIDPQGTERRERTGMTASAIATTTETERARRVAEAIHNGEVEGLVNQDRKSVV